MANFKIVSTPLAIALLLSVSPTLHSQIYDQARYATYRTWAISPPWKDHGYKIVSYIPESYLLYLADSEPILVSGQEYSLALTQDSVEVLILPQAISELSFSQSVGNHQVIFNSDYLLCKVAGCAATLEKDWLVARGEAFQIVSESSDFIALRGTRDGAAIEGYIRRSELDVLERIGKVTRADRLHPKYHIEKRQSGILGTSCGQTRAVGDLIEIPQGDNTTEEILQLLAVAQIKDTHAEVVSAYGGQGYLNRFYLYEIQDRSLAIGSLNHSFHVAVGLKVNCTLAEDGSFQENHIEHMTLVNSKNFFNGRAIAVEIPMGLFNTPLNLQQYTGDSYMLSINKVQHFEAALEILSSRIGDRALSGYILTELNRSCRSSMRVPFSQSPCLDYEY